MKRKKLIIPLLFFLLLTCAVQRSFAQATELAQLALNIEKLAQFKQILSDLKAGYDIVSKGYSTVKDIAEGNFSIHKAFLDGLMQVSPTVKKYRRVADIIDYQLRLVKEYKTAFNRYRGLDVFNTREIDYISKVYANLLDKSLKNLDELITVTTANKLRMSDDERIKAIDRIYDDMADKYAFLKAFNTDTDVAALGRLKEKNELITVKAMQGIEQ